MLVSGEGVSLDLRPAGAGSRGLAAALDLMLVATAWFVLLTAQTPFLAAIDPAGAAAVTITELAVAWLGYPLVSEWLGHGRTLGKLALGLRVVRDDGGPIAFRQALVRSLAGLLLERPGLIAPVGTAAGVITMTFNERGKRFGDLLAGTLVVAERNRSALVRAPALPVPPPALLPWALSVDLTGVDDDLALGLRQFVLRAPAMSDEGRAALEADLVARVTRRTAPAPPVGTPAPLVLMTVLAERRRRTQP